MRAYPEKSELIPEGLPPGIEIVAQGRKIGKGVTLGKTLFMQEHDVSSEAEYKRRMVSEGRVMYHFNVGLDSWQDTKNGLQHIYEEVTKRGARLDRFNLIFARPMGLPQDLRFKVPKETGLMLASFEEWLETGQAVPIQPQFGDMMIGSPASVENLLSALAAGATSIGSFAEYLCYEYPGWRDETAITIETVKALGIMAQLKDKGVVCSANLDDGPSSLLNDRVNYIGWAMLERYIVEDLIGAELKHFCGNLVTDPKMRIALLLALDEIHGRETAGGYFNGNTVYTQDLERNISILSSCLLFDIIGQLKRPTGHAIHVSPLTEHDRIPSLEETVQGVIIANQMEEEARKVADTIDLSQVEQIRDQMIEGGKHFYNSVIKGLEEIGINTTDPIELSMTLRKIGARKMEELFGAGERDDTIPNSIRPAIATEMFHHAITIAEKAKKDIEKRNLCKKAGGKKALLLSTDVHEYAKFTIGIALEEAGIEVVDIGHSIDPDQVVKALQKIRVDGICISTHNGMALTYAKNLLKELRDNNLDIPIFMGGRLNELTGESLPRDVTSDLTMLRIIPCNDIFDILDNLN